MLTAQGLREQLNYDPETGIFNWRVSKPGHAVYGKQAGAKPTGRGYCFIGIDMRAYPAHRLAWLWMTGHWPKSCIDHIDMDKGNNRWANLREATRAQNRLNTVARSDNRTGIKGVQWVARMGKFRARIMVAGKSTHLGYSDTKEGAAALYAEAAAKMHGEFARAA